MSYYVFDAKGYVGDLASNTGFMELREFVLKKDDPQLQDLFDDGIAVAKDVLEPLDKLPEAGDPDVQITVRNLQALAKKCQEIVILTDGFVDEEAMKGGPGSGELEGHPFRGNQYTQGEGGGEGKPGSSGGETETIYHGTSFRAVGEILLEGIRAGEYRNWSDHFYEGGRGQVVFVARGENGLELARVFAEKAEDETGKAAVIIEAKVPREYFDQNGKRDKAMPYDKYTGFEAMTLPEVKADWITNVYDKDGVVATKTINSLTGLRFKEKERTEPETHEEVKRRTQRGEPETHEEVKRRMAREPETHEEVKRRITHKADTVTVYIPVSEAALKKLDKEEAKKRKK